MAWITGVTFTTGLSVGYAFFNGVGQDLRSWGGNVNAAGYTLSNVNVSALSLTIQGATNSCLVLTAVSVTPTAPVDSTTTNEYLKGGKRISQFYDSGTIRYKYLDLVGAGAVWVETTTAP